MNERIEADNAELPHKAFPGDAINAIAQPVQPASIKQKIRTDVLDMAYINSLSQPFIGRDIGGWEWPINDFEVSTGLLLIDVCGLLQVKHISDFTSFLDDAGVRHPAEGFYTDANLDERQTIAQPVQPEQESVAEVMHSPEHGRKYVQYTQPIDLLDVGTKLYTSPPKRQPLTDDRIGEIWMSVSRKHIAISVPVTSAGIEFARAIEADLGIGDKT